MLDEYRGSFSDAYAAVMQIIRLRSEAPTGRIAKSTRSIVEKLRRESIRLSQMQDIAGCRVVVANIMEQNGFVTVLKNEFSSIDVIDRRENPGYRAVHVIVEVLGKNVEIQVRTALQHLWAELSEKASDVVDPAIKYGGGPDRWHRTLAVSSEFVQADEDHQIWLAQDREAKKAAVDSLKREHGLTDAESHIALKKVEEDFRRLAEYGKEILKELICDLDKLKDKGS